MSLEFSIPKLRHAVNNIRKAARRYTITVLILSTIINYVASIIGREIITPGDNTKTDFNSIHNTGRIDVMMCII